MKNVYLSAFLSLVTIVLALPGYAAQVNDNDYNGLIRENPYGIFVLTETAAYQNFMKRAEEKPGFALSFESEGSNGWNYYANPLELSPADVAARAVRPNFGGHDTSVIAVLSSDQENHEVLKRNGCRAMSDNGGITLFEPSYH